MCKYTNTQTETWHESTYEVVHPHSSSHLSKGLLHIKAYTYSIEKYTDMSSWIGTPTGSHMHITIYTHYRSPASAYISTGIHTHTSLLLAPILIYLNAHTYVHRSHTYFNDHTSVHTHWQRHPTLPSSLYKTLLTAAAIQKTFPFCWLSLGSPGTNSCFSMSPSPPLCSQHWQFAPLPLCSNNHVNTLQWHFT